MSNIARTIPLVVVACSGLAAAALASCTEPDASRSPVPAAPPASPPPLTRAHIAVTLPPLATAPPDPARRRPAIAPSLDGARPPRPPVEPEGQELVAPTAGVTP